MITLFINYLDSILNEYLPYKKTLDSLIKNNFPIKIEGADGFFRTYLIKKLANLSKVSTLVITPTEKDARIVLKDFQTMNDNVCYFPGWENVIYSANNYQSDIAGKRIHYLSELLTEKKMIIVLSLKTFLTPVPPSSFIKKRIVKLKIGDAINPVEWGELLVSYGYLRVIKVTLPGEFSLKGEVLDIFPHGRDSAIRIVYEWDEVEEIKLFNPLTQKSVEKLKLITIYPATEVLWDNERIDALKKILKSGKEYLEMLEIGKSLKNEEFLFSATFNKQGSFIDYLSDKSNIVLIQERYL